MSDTKFTPGPWTSVHDCDDEYYIEIVSRFSGHKCQLGSGTFSKEDAHLIAAAPDMYEALERLLEFGQNKCGCGSSDCTFCRASAALSKARGES